MIYIREARPEDGRELKELEARCPAGTKLIVSRVNTPDFFARARAYEDWKVFVASDDDRIVGSGACAVRQGLVGGELRRVAYQFQAFTDPDRRRQGVASLFHLHIEDYLTREDVALSYLVIVEDNTPAMRLVERYGFEQHRTLIMTGLALHEEMDEASLGTIRPASSTDLPAVADLLNDTWKGCELYVPASAESLAGFIERTPYYNLDNLLVLDHGGELLASLGYWDWSGITRITVLGLSRKMRMMGLLVSIGRHLRHLPPVPKPGDTLKQMVLTPVGFREPQRVAVLLRYVNNLALRRGFDTVFFVCERDHPLLSSGEGFVRIGTAMHLYVKAFQEGVSLGDGPVFMDGIDL
jgi:GNAT superfamily N-acetyltransferase